MPDGTSTAAKSLLQQVRQDYPTLVSVWNAFSRAHELHLLAETMDTQGEFLPSAFVLTDKKGLTGRFRDELLKAGLLDDEGARAWIEQTIACLNGSGYENQAVQNRVFLPKAAYASAKRLVQACEHVCRIDVSPGADQPFQHKGTGILVRPRLVATARHVVDDLLHYDKNRTLAARPGTHGRLQVTFGYMDDYRPDGAAQAAGNGVPAHVLENWLAWVSDALPRELNATLPHPGDVAGLGLPDGPWDLALIALAEPLKGNLHGHVLSAADPPRLRPFEVHVLHHPNGGNPQGQRLLWSIGLMGRTGIDERDEPALRLLHNAHTQKGSSGAPVFNDVFEVVALHQGGTTPPASNRTDDTGPKGNRAVPVCHWSKELDGIEARLPRTDYLTTVSAWKNQPAQPVYGRTTTQDTIKAAMQPGAEAASRLIVVRGKPGQGRRFTVRLLRELVQEPTNRIGVQDATNLLGDDVHAAANKFLGAFAAEPLAAGQGGDTTAQRDAKLLAGGLARRLDALAGDGGTWLAIYGLDDAKLDNSKGVPGLLQDLMNELGACKRLRLVLIGWQGHVPGGVVETLRPVDAADVRQHLTLRRSRGETSIDANEIGDLADLVCRKKPVQYSAISKKLEGFEAEYATASQELGNTLDG